MPDITSARATPALRPAARLVVGLAGDAHEAAHADQVVVAGALLAAGPVWPKPVIEQYTSRGSSACSVA